MMMNIRNVIAILFVLWGYACAPHDNATRRQPETLQEQLPFFSEHVRDSFYLSIQKPLEYADSTAHHYPLVYLLDANFFFPMLAPVLHQYEKAGLLPPLILVGIGYASWEAMDTLRQRDYLYPEALPSDEMTTQGGGQRYLSFVQQELMPHIQQLYRVKPGQTTLLGHSFGGYFPLFALSEQAAQGRSDFQNFVAASPTLWYHDFYLNRLPEQLKNTAATGSLRVLISVGAREDSTWSVQPVLDLAKSFEEADLDHVHLDTRIYPYADHMEVALPSFIQGLQSFYPVR